jgi:alpha-tubulin suppressor-like RCC1 family protein
MVLFIYFFNCNCFSKLPAADSYASTTIDEEFSNYETPQNSPVNVDQSSDDEKHKVLEHI